MVSFGSIGKKYAAAPSFSRARGAIHWLMRHRGQIAFYNVCTTEHGTIKLPDAVAGFTRWLHLGSYYSQDRRQKLLILLAAHGFKISVWYQLPGGDWAPEAVVIDMEEKLRSLLKPDSRPGWAVEFIKCPADGSNTVLLSINYIYYPRRSLLIILDLETKDAHVKHHSTSPSELLEVDLPSRLRAMKVFP
jgi:hypothetical protein